MNQQYEYENDDIDIIKGRYYAIIASLNERKEYMDIECFNEDIPFPELNHDIIIQINFNRSPFRYAAKKKSIKNLKYWKLIINI